ncbi:unnamed protein product [Boreogadus saida]
MNDEAAFAKYGNIAKADVIRDKDTGRSRGFGFVKFDNADEAKHAMEGMNGTSLDGRSIRVDDAGRGRSGGSSGGSRGSFGGGGGGYGDRSYNNEGGYGGGERSYGGGSGGGGYGGGSGGGYRDNQRSQGSYGDQYNN